MGRENLNIGHTNDFLGRTAQQIVTRTCSAVGAHDDEIDIYGVTIFQNLSIRDALLDLRCYVETTRTGSGGDFLDNFGSLCLLFCFELVRELLDWKMRLQDIEDM